MQELSVPQSSLFLQATGVNGMMMGGGVVVEIGVGSGDDVSTSGGVKVDPGRDTGCRGLSGCGISSTTGVSGGGGVDVTKAEHFKVGFPVVPGGHEQRTLWYLVLHSAFSPQSPG